MGCLRESVNQDANATYTGPLLFDAAEVCMFTGGLNLLSTNHAPSASTVVCHGWVSHQEVHELLVPRLEPGVREVVLGHDGLVVDAAEGENEGAEDASPVFARGAVQQDRCRVVRGGEVGEDLLVGLVVAAGGDEDVFVGFQEASLWDD